MLRSKGISKDIIDNTLAEEVDSDNEDAQCRELLEKKIKSIKSKDKYDLRNKLLRFGAGRGYDFETLNKHISELIKVGEN